MRPEASYRRHAVACLLVVAWVELFGGAAAPQTPQGAPGTRTCPAVKSVIDAASPSPWKVEAVNVKTKEPLTGVSFVDNRRGWVVGERKVYRTDDRGRTWEEVNLHAPQNYQTTRILFTSPSRGWAVLENTDFDPERRETWLMSTEDGGSTWRRNWRRKSAFEASIAFVDEEKGWIVHREFLPPRRYALKTLRTQDGGKTWRDVSEGLSKKLGDDGVCCPPKVTNLIAESEVAAVISTLSGRILFTKDGGDSWGEVESPCAGDGLRSPGAVFGRKGTDSYWLAEGARSLEGTWGKIYEQRRNGSWVRFDLPNFALADALYISSTHVLAAGSLIDPAEGRSQGSLLFSSDGGSTWSVVYRSDRSDSITALATTESKDVWAVGGNGLVLRLESLSKTVAATLP